MEKIERKSKVFNPENYVKLRSALMDENDDLYLGYTFAIQNLLMQVYTDLLRLLTNNTNDNNPQTNKNNPILSKSEEKLLVSVSLVVELVVLSGSKKDVTKMISPSPLLLQVLLAIIEESEL